MRRTATAPHYRARRPQPNHPRSAQDGSGEGLATLQAEPGFSPVLFLATEATVILLSLAALFIVGGLA